MAKLRTYSDLIRIPDFFGRYEYLRIGGRVGAQTFGSSRFLNQSFYTSRLWRLIRNEVIFRDHGCDLGIRDREIAGKIVIHHMNEVTEDDILDQSPILLDPEYLITTTLDTHNAIHYGDESLLLELPEERAPFDTAPWRT